MKVHALPFVGDDAALIDAIRAGKAGATLALVDRYGKHIAGVLRRVLGPDPELTDVLHDVIANALASLDRLRKPEALKAWLTQLAVFSARGVIRRRRRSNRWLSFFDPSDVPDVPSPETSPETRTVLATTYAILSTFPDDERIAFALRFFGQMELTDVAATLSVSLATVKRILHRAEARFLAGAQEHPAVRDAIEQGTRWAPPQSGSVPVSGDPPKEQQR